MVVEAGTIVWFRETEVSLAMKLVQQIHVKFVKLMWPFWDGLSKLISITHGWDRSTIMDAMQKAVAGRKHLSPRKSSSIRSMQHLGEIHIWVFVVAVVPNANTADKLTVDERLLLYIWHPSCGFYWLVALVRKWGIDPYLKNKIGIEGKLYSKI